MNLTVIVPVRNDAVRLARCLASLAADSLPPGTEVIVADNGSTDNSARVAEDAGARVLELPGLKVSELRNSAAREANGDLLAFVDADHQLLGGWTGAAIDAMRDETVGAAGAKYLPPPGGTWVQQMYGVLRGRTAGSGDTDWLGSGNMVVRRRAFAKVGGFDGSLEACEDVDLCRRLRAAGFRVIADERLRSVHHGDPPTLGALFRAERWRGRNNLQVSLRGPVNLRDLPSIVSPILTLAAVVAVAVGILGTMAGLSGLWIAVVAAGLVAALVLARTTAIASRLEQRTLAAIGRAAAVSLTYDLARAASLVAPARHHRK